MLSATCCDFSAQRVEPGISYLHLQTLFNMEPTITLQDLTYWGGVLMVFCLIKYPPTSFKENNNIISGTLALTF